MRVEQAQRQVLILTEQTEQGDTKHEYDVTDKSVIKKMVDLILNRLHGDYVLYGGKKGGRMDKIADKHDVDEKSLPKTLKELDKFMLMPGEKLLALPMVRG